MAADEEGCLECHGLAGFASRPGEAARPLVIAAPRFDASAHGALGCRECHADIASIPHGDAVRPVACGQACHGAGTGEYSHEKIWWEHAASAHGTAKTGGVGCLVCHPSPGPAAERDRAAEALRCASCHRGSAKVLAWFSDRHGRALAAGNPRAPSCPDCHTSHRVRPAGDEESTVNAARLPATCSGGALAEGRVTGCHGALSPEAVAGTGMNQLPRGASGAPARAAFSLLFVGLLAGLVLRSGIGLFKGR